MISMPTKNAFFFLLNFCPHRAAYGILVPRAGIEPVSPAVEAQRLNHWTLPAARAGGSRALEGAGGSAARGC